MQSDKSDKRFEDNKANVFDNTSWRTSVDVDIDVEVSETEITAEISVPKEDTWGWVVVAASFSCIFILDGTFFTFGSIYKDISRDLEVAESFISLINSVAIALYFMTGPVVSALINRYGFRFCSMTGSVIVSTSFFFAYFAKSYVILLLLYGVIPGLGGCFLYMSSQLVTGFYFERLRAIAMSIAGLGQSFGVMTMSTVNARICQIAGWRTTTLFHSGLFGLTYFISMIYRPLVSLTVTQATDDTKAITYLPSLSMISLQSRSRKRISDLAELTVPTAAERAFNAVSNINFPTVAELLEEGEEQIKVEKKDLTKPGPSSEANQSHYGEIIVKPSSDQPPKTKEKWWQKLNEKHNEESRPMYRDDAFYTGDIERLPAYKKSLVLTKKKKTGLEYRMAVSRTVVPDDLREKQGILTTSVRRILATMLNTKLLSRCSFLIICSAGFLTHVGLLVPYVFISERNRIEGIPQNHCNLFVSVIGFSNAVGRVVAGLMATRFSPVRVYSIACIFAGGGAIASNISFNVYYQYFCCVVFGASAAHMSTLRSLVIVDLYGLDNLTNATGVLLMFQGFGVLLSTPLSSVLKTYFSYIVSFCVAGSFIVSGGILIFSAKRVALKEDAKVKQEAIPKLRSRSVSFIKRPKDRNKYISKE